MIAPRAQRTVSALVVGFIFGVAGAEPLTREQINCALGLEQAGKRVASRVVDRFTDCLVAGLKKKLRNTTVTACLGVDRGRRIERAKKKTLAVAAKRCGSVPSIGPTNPQTVNNAAEAIVRASAIFGMNLDVTVPTDDRKVAYCRIAAARGLQKVIVARVRTFGGCLRSVFRTRAEPTVEDLRGCLDADLKGRIQGAMNAAGARVVRACEAGVVETAFPAACRGTDATNVFTCALDEAKCGVCLAFDRAAEFDAACNRLPVAPAMLCTSPASSNQSAARQWNEEMLAAIRIDLPRPPIHARNLFHVSVAMWDAWAAYDPVADPFLHVEKMTSGDVDAARHEAISFAAYRVLRHRFAGSASALTTRQALDQRMKGLCYDPSYEETNGNTPAALGNRIARTVIDSALGDGSNEAGNYADSTYEPVNVPLIVKEIGIAMTDPNRWQPLALDSQIGQNGIPIPGRVQIYVGPQWEGVMPFALTRPDASTGYLDPGPPPYLGGVGDATFKERILDMIRLASHLTPADGVRIDISPAGWGNNPLGTNDGHGYATNPVTGQPYTPQLVRRGDFARLLAEYWADGPTSETPPGHWNTVSNGVSDHPLLVKKIGGAGEAVGALEWDVKLYFALNGALHDAAIQCWGIKRRYDYVRPISMIRFMASRGQSSRPLDAGYDPQGLPLEDGLVEMITAETAAAGDKHDGLAEYIGEPAVLAWPGEPADPQTQHSGVRWVRAKAWVPYQRKTFVTPPFAAYTSGHSTFSRSAAELLARFTGSSYFPGGLGEFVVPPGGFLQFEYGPSEEVRLQWAQYYDAADQAGISRLYGGIHVAGDDFEGRKAGAQIGPLAWDKARSYFDGSGRP